MKEMPGAVFPTGCTATIRRSRRARDTKCNVGHRMPPQEFSMDFLGGRDVAVSMAGGGSNDHVLARYLWYSTILCGLGSTAQRPGSLRDSRSDDQSPRHVAVAEELPCPSASC